MEKNKITFEQLAGRLERAIHYDCGMQGLKLLLYGWRKHPAYRWRAPSQFTLTSRKHKTGSFYLTHEEVLSFSRYCGYDLREK